MDDLYWSAQLSSGKRLCVSPLSRETIQENEIENLGNDLGYFIYCFDETKPAAGIEILGKAASEDAAMRLAELLAPIQRD